MKVFIPKNKMWNPSDSICVWALDGLKTWPCSYEQGCHHSYNGVEHHCGDCGDHLSIDSFSGRLTQMEIVASDAVEAIEHGVKFRNAEGHAMFEKFLASEALFVKDYERFIVLDVDGPIEMGAIEYKKYQARKLKEHDESDEFFDTETDDWTPEDDESIIRGGYSESVVDDDEGYW